MALNRRQFFQVSAAGTVIAILAGRKFWATTKPESLVEKNPWRDAIASIAKSMLGEMLPPPQKETNGLYAHESLNDLIRGIEEAIQFLPEQQQSELDQLFFLLTFPPLKWLLTGIFESWDQASTEDVDKFLDRWAHSQLETLRGAYQGLRELTTGVWYALPNSWPTIDYKGPPW